MASRCRRAISVARARLRARNAPHSRIGAGMPIALSGATASPGGADAAISSIRGGREGIGRDAADREVQPSSRAIVCTIRLGWCRITKFHAATGHANILEIKAFSGYKQLRYAWLDALRHISMQPTGATKWPLD